MAWIYFQVLEGSDSHYRLGSEPFVIANETDTHKAFFCPECDQVTLIRPLFGMTSQHYERSCCLESTLSQEAFRARISALQGVERAWTESEAVFSSRSQDSLENASLDLFSSKMSLPSELVEGKEWLKNWPRSGMTVGGRLFQPPQLEPHTNEKGGSYLPTPTATQYGRNKSREGNKERPSLDTMARKNLWPTPTVCGNYQNKGNMIGLATAVNMWPTPTASDHLHNRSEMLENWKKRAEEKKKQGVNLQFALRHAVQKSNPTGQLSPMWVEWLMGYRIGHTELSASVIQWFRSKSGRRSKN